MSAFCKAGYPGPDPALISVRSRWVGDVRPSSGEPPGSPDLLPGPSTQQPEHKVLGSTARQEGGFSERTERTRVSQLAEVSSKGSLGNGGGGRWERLGGL